MSEVVQELKNRIAVFRKDEEENDARGYGKCIEQYERIIAEIGAKDEMIDSLSNQLELSR